MSFEPKPWTISVLIEALQKAQEEHGDVQVRAGGCDCDGDVYGLRFWERGPSDSRLPDHVVVEREA